MSENVKNTILIIDDETSNLMYLNNILYNDYSIFTAKDGSDVINKAVDISPDLILLDIIMPRINGYEALVKLKADEKTKNIPVILVTGLNNIEDEEKGLTLDAADYITKPFSDTIVKLRVQNQIRIVNQMRTIERLSMIDQLTEIANRRSFDRCLNVEWLRAIRNKYPISLLIIDVDNFKAYNDTYGHQQGDIALKAVARTLLLTLKRPGDLVARWGGEEFTVLLPSTESEGALMVAEMMREDAEKLVIPNRDGTDTKITLSIGINTRIPVPNDPICDFFSKADAALYTAKASGRNRVCSHPPP